MDNIADEVVYAEGKIRTKSGKEYALATVLNEKTSMDESVKCLFRIIHQTGFNAAIRRIADEKGE